jgi:predicted RNase H-like nuclease (RuvC/YqgF family)
MEEEDKEKRRKYLLKDQERRCEKVDEMFNEYNKLNCTIDNIKKMVADLVLEEKRVDDEMTSLRYKINVEERKVREINKMLRSNEDPRRMPRGERDGKESL